MSALNAGRFRLAIRRTLHELGSVSALTGATVLIFAGCTVSSRPAGADGGANNNGASGGIGSSGDEPSGGGDTESAGGKAGLPPTDGVIGASGGSADNGVSGGGGNSSAGSAAAEPNVIGTAVPDGPCAALTGSAGASPVAETTELCDVASSLSGLRWELKCTAPPDGVSCKCAYSDIKDAQLQGMPGATYDITLHFRGVVEQKTYLADPSASEGAAGAAGSSADTAPSAFVAHGLLNANLFSVGGTPDDGPYNLYQLDVSDPKQTYYLNAGKSGSFYVFPIDYVVTIRVKGGATVKLTANSIEGLENPNLGANGSAVVVPGVPPAPISYDGQFVQMDVESVALAP